MWEAVHTIRSGLYNIYNGRDCIFEFALQVMLQGNLFRGLFQEKHITKGIYTR